MEPTTAAMDGFLLSPAGGCVTSTPRKITGSLNTCRRRVLLSVGRQLSIKTFTTTHFGNIGRSVSVSNKYHALALADQREHKLKLIYFSRWISNSQRLVYSQTLYQCARTDRFFVKYLKISQFVSNLSL